MYPKPHAKKFECLSHAATKLPHYRLLGARYSNVGLIIEKASFPG